MSSGTLPPPLEHLATAALADEAVRHEALDTTRSFIVQAPAGSGKTELLTQRFVALLSEVDESEEVLAITFTRAATAEMRARVVEALEAAQSRANGSQSGSDKASAAAQELGDRALRHAERRGWRLLEQPQRLNIQTIDSLCLRIAHQAPLLSRLGGRLTPTEDAQPLYGAAARRTLELLGGPASPVADALEAILRLRDTSLADCERLIADMLARRDQWVHLFPAGQTSEEDWARVREALERPLAEEHDRVLSRAREILRRDPELAREVLALANYACGFHAGEGYSRLLGLSEVDQLAEAGDWHCVCELLLTAGNTFRRQLNKANGFPTEKDGGCKKVNARVKEFLPRLTPMEDLLEALCAVRSLPPLSYDEAQWLLVRQILTMLLRAVAELRVIFAERGEVDFAEIGLAARTALAERDVAYRWSEGIRHILVDEFQDTSRPQHELLGRLIAEWQPGDRGRTCFVVGDPMQSIYLFRQAEVELFGEARAHGLPREGGPFPLTPLTLQTNFRSTSAVVGTLNEIFAAVFPSGGGARDAAAVRFAPSTAAPEDAAQPRPQPRPPGGGVHLLPDFLTGEGGRPSSEERDEARRREARAALAILRAHQPRIEAAKREGRRYTVAVLVRARAHLAHIADLLRQAHIPYRSVEIETLGERQEVLDLRALVRALVNPMDRIAWLSVLRAPWCGLGLADLHALCGDEEQPRSARPLLALLAERLHMLPIPSRARAGRVLTAMTAALGARGRGTLGASPAGFATWIEQTWEALGGRACLNTEALGNVEVFFRMVAELSPDGLFVLDGTLEHRLERLFALPDPETDERHGVQLMTIHKAKGLGFDTVIVPGLERSSQRDTQSLLCWMTRQSPGSAEREILLAPIGRKGAPSGKKNYGDLYGWVRAQRERQAREEQQRLLYVACSRAKSELHLFGTACIKTAADTGNASASPFQKPRENSLLGTLWPHAESYFLEKWNGTRTAGAPAPEPAQESMGQMLAFPSSSHEQRAMPGQIARLAAEAEELHEARRFPRLQRLPADWQWSASGTNIASGATGKMPGLEERAPGFELGVVEGEIGSPRAAGSRETRIRGVVIHMLLEQIARSPSPGKSASPGEEVQRWRTAAQALLRQYGMDANTEAALVREVEEALMRTLGDPTGRWLLANHQDARSESAWSSDVSAESAGEPSRCIETLRADRVFLAGPEPGVAGETHLWIVDYKTAKPPGNRALDDFLTEEWERHTRQLAGYSRALRHVYGDRPQRLGLYYPLLPKLDWRAVESDT